MKGKLLITGGAGFIGRNVAMRAVELGYDVTSFDVNECDTSEAKSVIGDIRDIGAITNAAKGMDYVIHLAAITVPMEFEKEMEKCLSINVTGTINVFDAARQNKCKKVLYASSAAVYIDEFSESTVIPHFKLRNYYAKTKLIDEMIAHSYRDAYRMDIIGM